MRPKVISREFAFDPEHSDGTLITQRLHFVALPHPYRHVLGWYRLVKELQDFNVNAICVFDGKERNIAKAKEVRDLPRREFLC